MSRARSLAVAARNAFPILWWAAVPSDIPLKHSEGPLPDGGGISEGVSLSFVGRRPIGTPGVCGWRTFSCYGMGVRFEIPTKPASRTGNSQQLCCCERALSSGILRENGLPSTLVSGINHARERVCNSGRGSVGTTPRQVRSCCGSGVKKRGLDGNQTNPIGGGGQDLA